MLSVPADQFNDLNQAIKFWQNLFGWSTLLAAIFGIAVVIWDAKFFTRWHRLKLPLGIISGLFWVSTVFLGNRVNTKTSQLQQQYAKQTEDAETRIANLKPTVDRVKSTVDTLNPLVNKTLKPKVDTLNKTLNALQPKVNLLEGQVKSLNPKVNALVSERNTIKDFHIEVSYPVIGSRMENTEILSNGYIAARRNGPKLRCQGFTLALYAYNRYQDNMGENEHINHIDYFLINPIELRGKPIATLDTCSILSIGLLDLEVENKPPPHEMFESISWMTAQPVINNSPLQEIHIETTRHYWEPRIEDGGFITFNLKDNPIKLSQQYAGSYNSKVGNTDQAH